MESPSYSDLSTSVNKDFQKLQVGDWTGLHPVLAITNWNNPK